MTENVLEAYAPPAPPPFEPELNPALPLPYPAPPPPMPWAVTDVTPGGTVQDPLPVEVIVRVCSPGSKGPPTGRIATIVWCSVYCSVALAVTTVVPDAPAEACSDVADECLRYTPPRPDGANPVSTCSVLPPGQV